MDRKIPLNEISVFCRKWNILEFSLFGSVLREDFSPESDIDVLVLFHPDTALRFFDLVHMQDELKEIFGREVDLVSKRGVEASRNPIRRKAILESARSYMLRDKKYLIDIIEAAKLAVEYLKGQTENEFHQNIEKQDSVIRRLEIIGEAARRISEESKRRCRKCHGMR